MIDRCAGTRLADWLRDKGHNVVESRERGSDPGDLTLLNWARDEQRILVTIDKDFGTLLFLDQAEHTGLVRLPDVPASRRIELMEEILDRYSDEMEAGAIVTVRGARIRIRPR